MLVLTRKPEETIIINGNIEVQIIEVKGNRVRIGITAPREISVNRGEVQAEVNEKNKNSDKT